MRPQWSLGLINWGESDPIANTVLFIHGSELELGGVARFVSIGNCLLKQCLSSQKELPTNKNGHFTTSCSKYYYERLNDRTYKTRMFQIDIRTNCDSRQELSAINIE